MSATHVPERSVTPPRGVLARLVAFSIRRRWLVLLAALAVALFSIASLARLRIDAVPDITTVQVEVDTQVQGLAPEEIERQITFPIEAAMGGIPDVVETRSLSRYGLSQVTVVFKDGTDIYFARQRVNERLEEARSELPPEWHPEMGPISTALGEIVRWTVETKPGATKADGTPYTTTDLREIEDWIIKPQLRNVPGVTEISSLGGFRRQIHVTPDPNRLVAYGLGFDDVVKAIEDNNVVMGAGFVERKGEQYLVSASGRLKGAEDLRDVVIAERRGLPIRVRDVATVGEGQELRGGAATSNGREVVIGSAIMLIGENSRTVSERVLARLAQIQHGLPPGVIARTVYTRSKLVNATLETVRSNLVFGALLVIVVLLLLLGNVPGALIVAVVIPLSLLFAIIGMVTASISANLLSLGAVDFGIIVDGAVVMIENVVRRVGALEQRLGRLLTAEERSAEVGAAAQEMAGPILTGVGIIMIVYLPILTLQGIEGKMFRPMAEVVLLALGGALLMTYTFVPAAAAALLRRRVASAESAPVAAVHRAYRPALRTALAHRGRVLAIAAVLLAGCALLATRIGSEFVPQLDEGDILVVMTHLPGTNLDQNIEMEHQIDRTLSRFPEVQSVFSLMGTGDVANDPMPPSDGDVYAVLKPRSEWPHPRERKEALIERMQVQLAALPGNEFEFSQPIEDRFNELIAGVRSDVAVKIYGDDLDLLRREGVKVARELAQVKGAADVKVEQTAGLPTLAIDIDRTAAGRYGLSVAQVQSTIHTALAGEEAGTILSGDRRSEIVVRLPESVRRDLSRLDQIPVALPAAAGSERPASFVPLGSIAQVKLAEGPNEIRREEGKRLIVVTANVRGRDLGGFVAEAQRRIGSRVSVPPGYWVDWGGQFENLIAARKRLAVVVPVALLLIFLLLLGAFGSSKDALLVFSGVPFALTGGILALLARGMPLSITAVIGFIALSGVAVLNGVVLISAIQRLRGEGAELDRAVSDGCEMRLRPVLMTALVASLGFIPMALATGTGSEVQRPLATVVIGGILSSTLLTLIVLPVLYRWAHGRDASWRAAA
jgi:cobalt-zinc-cadmium resistance protein CzcA